jgi:hypothetical protein
MAANAAGSTWAGAATAIRVVGAVAGGFAGGAASGGLNAAVYGGNIWQAALYGGLIAAAVAGAVQTALEFEAAATTNSYEAYRDPKKGRFKLADISDTSTIGGTGAGPTPEGPKVEGFSSEETARVSGRIKEVVDALMNDPSKAPGGIDQARNVLNQLKKNLIAYDPGMTYAHKGEARIWPFSSINKFYLGPAGLKSPDFDLAGSLLHETIHTTGVLGEGLPSEFEKVYFGTQ